MFARASKFKFEQNSQNLMSMVTFSAIVSFHGQPCLSNMSTFSTSKGYLAIVLSLKPAYSEMTSWFL